MQLWGFIWLMVVLKIPIAMLLYLVWWAIRQSPDAEADPGEGGMGDRHGGPPAKPRWPRRRGPHGEPTVPAPARTRVTARSRDRAAR